MKKDRIAIVDGLRTPIAKASGKLKDIQADNLGAHIVQELALKVGLDYSLYDEVIVGNVSQPAHAANIARVIAIKAGFEIKTPAYTVHRNCASGMESISTATSKIFSNRGDIYMCGGVESMSNIPFIYSPKMRNFFESLFRARSMGSKLKVVSQFRPAFLKPIVGLMQGLTDPTNGLIMGSTAEVLAQDFGITREEQDIYAAYSHNKAQAAQEKGVFQDEIAPVVYDLANAKVMKDDDGIRYNQTKEKLAKLKPFFDRKNGTVTAGNSSQVSDAAAAVVIMKESKAKELGIKPLGYLLDYEYAGLDPKRMGLGPVYATSKILKRNKFSLKDMELIEMNEAFAVQILANLKAFDSKFYARQYLNSSKAVGEINEDILNIHGGSIALGHPVGMTGTRIVLHLLKSLRASGKQRGLATLCIGGGQGGSMILEVE